MSLKILSLIEFFDPSFFGGSGKVLFESNYVLAEKGHSVHIICRTPPEVAEYGTVDNIIFHTYPDISGGQIKKLVYYCKSIKKLFIQTRSEIKFDFIVIHSSASCLGLVSILKTLNIPIIYYFHSPWHREYEIIANPDRNKNICGIQCPLISTLSAIRKRHELKYLNLASGIITLSESMQNIMLDDHKGIAMKPLLVDPGAANGDIFFPTNEIRGGEIGNQLSVSSGGGDSIINNQNSILKEDSRSRVAIRRELALPEDVFLIITSRRLVPRTGVDVLIKAFAEVKKVMGGESRSQRSEVRGQNGKAINSKQLSVNSGKGRGDEHPTSNIQHRISNGDKQTSNHQITKSPNLKLILTGGGTSEDKLKQLAVDLGIQDDVIFTGYVEEEKLAEYYRCSDLFVMPTKFLEGFGLSTVEAMASGLPVIGTDIGGTPKILRKISEELIIPECSVDAIAEKIVEFVSKDDLDYWRRKSVKCFHENFTWKKHVDRLLEFVENII
jgi:glycosyltransferase involved in cell wall biosynthesis